MEDLTVPPTENGKDVPTHVSKERFTFVENGPLFKDLLTDGRSRDDIIHSTKASHSGRHSKLTPFTIEFTEREGLNDLERFLQNVIDTANQKGNRQTFEEATALRNNLVYIGEHEFDNAIQGLADRVLSEARLGSPVFIFVGGQRSEKYVSLRLLEQIDTVTEGNEELRNGVRVSESSLKVAAACKKDTDRTRVFVPDDFVLSGTRINGFVWALVNGLETQGVSQDTGLSITTGLAIAAPLREEPPNFRLFSYYGVPEIRGLDDSWLYCPGVSITGSHASVDYGYEDLLRKFQMDALEIPIPNEESLPLLYGVDRPYEKAPHPSNAFLDPKLETRWQKMAAKYELGG